MGKKKQASQIPSVTDAKEDIPAVSPSPKGGSPTSFFTDSPPALDSISKKMAGDIPKDQLKLRLFLQRLYCLQDIPSDDNIVVEALAFDLGHDCSNRMCVFSYSSLVTEDAYFMEIFVSK